MLDNREVAGVRRAIEWLHERAKEMNDVHAQVILNSAATNLGWALKRWQDGADDVGLRNRAHAPEHE